MIKLWVLIILSTSLGLCRSNELHPRIWVNAPGHPKWHSVYWTYVNACFNELFLGVDSSYHIQTNVSVRRGYILPYPILLVFSLEHELSWVLCSRLWLSYCTFFLFFSWCNYWLRCCWLKCSMTFSLEVRVNLLYYKDLFCSWFILCICSGGIYHSKLKSLV